MTASPGTLPLLGGVDRARFRKVAVPGDMLALDVDVTSLSARAGRAGGRATVDGRRCAEAGLLFVLAPD